MAENKVLRIIFEHTMEGSDRVWIKLYTEVRHNFYSSLKIFKMVRYRGKSCTGFIIRIVAKRNAYNVLVRGAEGKRPPGRPNFWPIVKKYTTSHNSGVCGYVLYFILHVSASFGRHQVYLIIRNTRMKDRSSLWLDTPDHGQKKPKHVV